MGDRGNIRIITGEAPRKSEVFLYTHWSGSDLPTIVKKALSTQEARKRWDDGYYLARILFCHLVPQDQWRGETGYGISSIIGDGEDQVITVDVNKQTVKWKGVACGFVDFCK
jgi:hypothetical protein